MACGREAGHVGTDLMAMTWAVMSLTPGAVRSRRTIRRKGSGPPHPSTFDIGESDIGAPTDASADAAGQEAGWDM